MKIIELINAVLVIAGLALVSILLAVYAGYITGVIVALAAGKVLGISIVIIPHIFAWAYAGISIVALMIVCVRMGE